MKTKNNTRRKQRLGDLIISTLQWTGLVTLAFVALISCQKKESSSSNYVAPLPLNQAGVVGNCVGCNFAQAPLASGVISRASNVEVSWNLIGDQVALQQLVAYGYSPKLYSGAIAVTGNLVIKSTVTLGGGAYYSGGYGCQIQAGSYTIGTTQVGQMNQGTFTIPQFEAVSGTTRIIFALNNAVVADPGSTGTITQVYGQLVPMGVSVNGAQIVQCSDAGVYLAY